MKKVFVLIATFLVLIATFTLAQQNTAPQPSPDVEDKTLFFPFNGQWLPDYDPITIGAKNYKTLRNFRYTDTSLEGISGYSKVNTTPVAYAKIRNGFQLKKDQPVESHVIVQTYNAGETASVLYDNTTVIPSQGNFSGTTLHTDASGASVGRFSQGPNGTVIYCNGVESKIWGGNESRVGAFITATAGVTNSIANPRDFTEKVNNTLDDEDQLALIGGGKDSYTKLLLHFDGTSGSTTFTDSVGTHTVTPGGNVAITDAQVVFGSGSGEFDGTGDYLSIPDHADFNFGTGTLTIDLRVMFDTITGVHVLYSQKDATNGDHVILWQDHTEGKIHFQATESGASVISEQGTWAPVADTWYHVAVLRGWGGVADAWAITVDGTTVHTFTDSGTMPDHNQVVLIGGNLGNYAIDSTARHPAISVNNGALLSGTSSYFGNGAWYFDGTDDCLSTAAGTSVDFDLYNQTNSTIDFWIALLDHTGTDNLCALSVDANNYWELRNVHGTGLQLLVATGGVVRYTLTADLGGSDGIDDVGWHHVAVIKVGNEFGIYVDGIQYAHQSNANLYNLAAGTFYIAASVGPSGPTNAYIEDVRITHTNVFSASPVAGLTDTITVPPSTIIADSNTKFLLHGDKVELDGWIDEFRLKKGNAAWTANFAKPIRAYSTESLYWVMGSTRPLDGVKLYVENANTISGATIVGTTWNGYSWTSLTNLTDNTSGLELTGTITFDTTVGTSVPKFLNGYYLYWYQFTLSSGAADIYYATISAPFQSVVDIWDGVNRQPITFQASRDGVYEDYTLEVNESSYPTVPITATLGDIDNDDFVIIMFDDRTTAMQFEILAGHGNTTNATTTVYYWDGSAWVATANVVDGTLDATGTDTLNQTGVISWTPPDIETEFPRELFGVTGYAYKLMFSATLLAGTNYDGTSVDRVYGIPAQLKVPPFRFSALYKNMVMLGGFTKSSQGNRMDFSMPNSPDVHNGELSSNNSKQSLFFGGEEALTGAVQLYNRFGSNIFATLVVFKNAETYLLTGDYPKDGTDKFKIYPLSLNIGCPAPLTVATAEIGYEVAQDAQRNVVLFLSNTGPMMLDGAVFVPIKGVDKYFDPNESTYINPAYYSAARAWYDMNYKEYNLLIPSGSGQATNNLWLVYDLVRKKWYEKYPSAYPQSGWPVIDTYGKRHVYAGLDTGYMMRTENGASWDGTDITQTVETGDFFPSENPWDVTRLRRVKLVAKDLTENDNFSVTHYGDTDNSGTTEVVVLDLNDATGYRIARDTEPCNLLGWSHRLKFEGSTGTETKGIKPIMWGIQYRRERLDQ